MFTKIISTSESVMLDKFQHIVDQKFPFLRDSKLYLAISGGKDSITLSHLLLKSNIQHTLLHCNFKLRGKESDEDEIFLSDYAKKNKLEFHVNHFDTNQIAADQKLTIQECARKLRYDWFRTFLDENENSYLLTAHHLDDSIETFFINLFRGTGFRGLSGIPVFVNKIVRPLSDFTSDEIYQYLGANQIEYRKDSSNIENNYLRNKIRNTFLPSVLEMEPEFQSKMAILFDEMTQLKNLVENEVDKFKSTSEKSENNKLIYELNEIKNLQPFFREQVFRSTGIYRKNEPEFSKFLTAETGAQFYTDSHHFLIDRSNLVVIPKANSHHDLFALIHSLPLTASCGNQTISFSKKSDFELVKNNSTIQQLDSAEIILPLTIRKWQPSDKIQPLGMTGKKLISDILIDKKVDRFDKENCLVLFDAENKMLCLIGFVVDERFKITSNTKEIIEIKGLGQQR